MRILLDECVHSKVAQSLLSHSVQTVQEAGWRGVKNGALLRLAATKHDVFITSDKNLEYQHNVETLPIPVITIATHGNMWEDIEPIIPKIEALLSTPIQKTFYRIELIHGRRQTTQTKRRF